jgi:hypothetical protein
MRDYFDRINFIYNILTVLNIPCTMNVAYEGWQLRFPWCAGDVAAHRGTYGQAVGKVESYRFPWDEGDVTVLTPEEAAIKIIALYNSLEREDQNE